MNDMNLIKNNPQSYAIRQYDNWDTGPEEMMNDQKKSYFMTKIKHLFCLIILFVTATTANVAIYYVSNNESNENSGLSIDEPFKTIQFAMDCTYPLLTGIKIKNGLTVFTNIIFNHIIRHQIINFSHASGIVKVKLRF